jgi:GMP synthase (glutamine-hydrolysing)
MRLHWLQHVPFEGLGFIREWAALRRVQITGTRLYAGEHLPSSLSADGLVIMGGPMGIHDHDEHPWLVEEKAFIREMIEAGLPVIGICLGAQLIADALGAEVYPGPHKEIGWFTLQRAPEAPDWIPAEFTAFHWHGDTFDLPADATLLASSDACRHQGFVYRDRVVGLQFHLESTHQSIEALITNCGDELVEAPYIQSDEQMRRGCSNIAATNTIMNNLLNKLLQVPR